MKRGTPDHPKVLELAALLEVRRPTAIGHLELLFHFTSQYAPEGNIGKYSNRRIAAALDWNGRTDASADRFIQAFIDSGWIDRCETNRLVTHDWAVHMDRVTRQRLKNSGKDPVDSGTFETPRKPVAHPYDTRSAPVAHPYDTRSAPESTQSIHKVNGKSCTQGDSLHHPSTTTTTTTSTSTSTATEIESEKYKAASARPPESPPPLDLADIRDTLHDYVRQSGIEWPPPDDALCKQVQTVWSGTFDDFGAHLGGMLKRHRKPSESYAWFLTVLRK